MIQLYLGDGKGKTSAAMGAVLRCIGQGGRAGVFQFLKSGESGEVGILKTLKNVDYFNDIEITGFYHTLTESEKNTVSEKVIAQLKKVSNALSSAKYNLIVLDEVIDLIDLNIISEEFLVKLLSNSGNTELILTGHKPYDKIIDISDYYTYFYCKKHPYNKGIKGRKGIEY